MISHARVASYHGGEVYKNGYKHVRGMFHQDMKFTENNELLAWFVKKFINQTRDKSDIMSKTLAKSIRRVNESALN